MKRHCIIPFLLTSALFSLAALPSFAAGAQSQPPQGVYEISSALEPGFVLDTRTCTAQDEISSGEQVQMYRSLDVNQQKFYLEQFSGHRYYISSLLQGQMLTARWKNGEPLYGEESVFLSEPVLSESAEAAASSDQDPGSNSDAGSEGGSDEASGGSSDAGAGSADGASGSVPAKYSAPKPLSENQTWIISDSPDGYYYLKSSQGGYLTLNDSYLYNGCSLSLQAFTGADNQKWAFCPARISPDDYADTDLVNPYAPDGPYDSVSLTMWLGKNRIVLTSEEIASWFSDPETHSPAPVEEAFVAYAQKLADQYNTKGQPRRFVTSYGNAITLYQGSFGWVLDVTQTARALQKASLENKERFAVAVWKQKGGTLEKGNDIGDSYVEIDLINQKVWLYQNGTLLLECDCVSGTYGTDRQTPGGVYFINYKQSPATLNGPGYSNYVDYWMPFNGGIGLHDANWRSEFGGTIFQTNGSHGCINLPTEAAKKIYETVSAGYPVVCYS